MFRTPLCPSSGASQLHMQSLVPMICCTRWLLLFCAVFVWCSYIRRLLLPVWHWWISGSWFRTSLLITLNVLQHSRTEGHNEPSTTRDQRLHVQLRSSWWWAQWCPKHVERNNVNEILRIFKTKYIYLAFLFQEISKFGCLDLSDASRDQTSCTPCISH